MLKWKKTDKNWNKKTQSKIDNQSINQSKKNCLFPKHKKYSLDSVGDNHIWLECVKPNEKKLFFLNFEQIKKSQNQQKWLSEKKTE